MQKAHGLLHQVYIQSWLAATQNQFIKAEHLSFETISIESCS